MRTSKILNNVQTLATEFERCCRDYASLHVAVAWCGDPQQVLPHKHLEDFKGKIIPTIGISFNQTHPNAIEWFMRMGADIRIFRKDRGLFHPKVFLFTSGDRYALFVGSSNLTNSGFYRNREVNLLTEGTLSAHDAEDIRGLVGLLEEWRSDDLSLKPDNEWLQGYRKDYNRDIAKQKANAISTAVVYEEKRFGRANWLEIGDWKTYYREVIAGLERHGREAESLHRVLDAAARSLPYPWKRSYFKQEEARHIIGGDREYGAMGHVAARGTFSALLKSGKEKWGTIITAVNSIAEMNPPINWEELESRLRKLRRLGFTMRVWGRVLCLVRPDLYCTVSSDSFRRELAKVLSVAKSSFEEPEGYVQLIKLLHSSPWFNSARPQDPGEAAVWEARVAFMDGIFWAPKDA